MALKHTVKRTLTTDAGGGLSDSLIVTFDSEVNTSILVAAGTTKEVDIALDVSQIQSIGMKCDQDVTVKTNSSTTPAQTFVLTAKVANLWNTTAPEANHWTVDVTKVFVVNATLVDATFELFAGLDLTP